MDYEIKPVSRMELRLYGKLFRTICGYTKSEPINPVSLLDKLTDLEGFKDVCYEVVCDSELPKNVPAQCIPQNNDYLIQIKESVYNSARLKGVGGSRAHILHEIMHVFLDKLGIKPLYTRTFKSKLPPYRSLEWAVKAITGEVMMPYEATKGMSENELVEIYGVSKDSAKIRLTY